MTKEEMEKAMHSIFKKLPPNGTPTDFEELDKLFTEHFPDAKTVTLPDAYKK